MDAETNGNHLLWWQRRKQIGGGRCWRQKGRLAGCRGGLPGEVGRVQSTCRVTPDPRAPPGSAQCLPPLPAWWPAPKNEWFPEQLCLCGKTKPERDASPSLLSGSRWLSFSLQMKTLAFQFRTPVWRTWLVSSESDWSQFILVEHHEVLVLLDVHGGLKE